MARKVYGIVLIRRVKACKKSQLIDVKGSFKDRRGKCSPLKLGGKNIYT